MNKKNEDLVINPLDTKWDVLSLVKNPTKKLTEGNNTQPVMSLAKCLISLLDNNIT
jgi:hypothetical protein